MLYCGGDRVTCNAFILFQDVFFNIFKGDGKTVYRRGNGIDELMFSFFWGGRD